MERISEMVCDVIWNFTVENLNLLETMKIELEFKPGLETGSI